MSYEENIAMMFVQEHKNQKYVYKGNNEILKNECGYFSLITDQNCCAPSDQILFLFHSNAHQKIMDVEQFLNFISQCEPF